MDLLAFLPLLILIGIVVLVLKAFGFGSHSEPLICTSCGVQPLATNNPTTSLPCLQGSNTNSSQHPGREEAHAAVFGRRKVMVCNRHATLRDSFRCAAFAGLIVASAHVSAFTVTMTANAEGGDKPTIVGTTNLPDGISLMVTVSRKESKFMGQDKAKVSGGAFRAGPFSQGGSALNPGTYTIEISTPLPSLQPPQTWPVIGNDGANLQGPLVKKSKYGGNVVEYSTTFKLGEGKASADKDNIARTQSDKDMHDWWLKNCKSNCNLVQSSARQRGETFDWDRCYYKCVADEPKRK